MSRLVSILALSALVLVGLGMIWLTMPPTASAQCGNIESSCAKCHQTTHPVCSDGTAWHSEYGHRNTCWNCHGGNDTTQDQELAHVGLVRNPLDDAYTSCYVCHPENYQTLAQRYAQSLGIRVSFRQPSFPTNDSPSSSAITAPIAKTAVESPIITPYSLDWGWRLGIGSVMIAGAFIWFMWKTSAR
jgi:hypothetical protein